MPNRISHVVRTASFFNVSRILSVCCLAALVLGAYAWRQQLGIVNAQANTVAAISAASYEPTLAPDSIAAAFGSGLATTVAFGIDTDTNTPGVQLPTTLEGTTVEIAGRRAGLFFISPTQVNFAVPSDAPAGQQTIKVTAGNGAMRTGTVTISNVAPAIFTANASGVGLPAALALRVAANGAQTYEVIATYDNNMQQFNSVPINLGPAGEQVYLILYASGLRRAADTNRDGNVNETIRVAFAGDEVVPAYAGAVPGLVGLDQVNVLIPRSVIGRGKISLSLASTGSPSSNITVIDIAGAAGNAPPAVTGFGTSNALAGQIVTIQGSGFSSVAGQNLVRIGDLEAPVVNASPSQLSALVPFGVESGPVTVRTTQGETRSSNRLGIRTSVSGVVETTSHQPLSDVNVQLISLATGARISTRTGANGAFVAADVPTGGLFLRVLGSSVSSNPSLETITLPVTSAANRDNPYRQTIFLQPVVGSSAQVGGGGSGFAGNGEQTIEISVPSYKESPDAEDQSATKIQTGNLVFELPANAAVTFPDGATRGTITLTQVSNSRVPVNLPEGIFSSTIAQISPFGTKFNPGGKLTFPNAEGYPGGSIVRLYRFDQNEESATLGQFIVAGEARVSADGQLIETGTNAVTEGGYYFASMVTPTTTVTGRVLDADRTPVRNALVNLRGQEELTDGNGGFIIRNVPVRSSADLFSIEASLLRATGRVDRVTRNSIEPVLNGLTTIRPELVLPSANSNQPPIVLAPSSLVINVNEITNVPILAGDPDSELGVTLNVTGANFVTFTKLDNPPRGYNLRLAPTIVGDYTLVVAATDSVGARVSANIKVTVIQPNRAPVLVDQLVTLDEDETKTFTLNGTDPDRDQLRWTVLTQPTKGKLSGTPPNLTYVPDANYFGRDSFTFKATDGKLESPVVTLFLQVNSVNDAPVLILPAPPTVKEGETLTFIVSGTDTDGDSLTFTAPSLPQGASFLNAERKFTWTPSFTQSGKYTITLAVFDDGTPPKSDVRSLEITVTEVNRLPVATTQEIVLDEDTSKAIVLSGTDADEDPLTYSLFSQPTKGTLSGTVPNLVYTPNKDANGSDSFLFRVNDGKGFSAPTPINLTIKPINDLPTTTNQTALTDEDNPVDIRLNANDIDGDTLLYGIVTQPRNGRITGDGQIKTYTPNLDFNGTDSFTFKVYDGTGDSNTSTVTVTVKAVNDVPTVQNKTLTTQEDVAIFATLMATDVDNDPITYTVLTQPTKGKLSGTAPDLVYTPDTNANGTDSFTFRATDGKLTSSIATITINITPANDAPVATNRAVTTDEDTAVNIAVAATDIDGDTLLYGVVAQPTKGKLTGTAPNLVYTPNLNVFGTDTFTFKAYDGTVDSNIATVTITIRPVNDPPVGRPFAIETAEGVAKSFVLDGSDIDGDPLTFTIVTQPTKGALSGNVPNLTYTPRPLANGPDSFTYRVGDGTVTTNPITVTIAISSVNDPPTLVVPGPQTVAENQTLTFTISATDPDDGTAFKYSAPKLPTGASFIESQRLFVWTPTFDQAGTFTAAFNVSDQGNPPLNSYKEVTITVTNTNRPPRGTTQTVTTPEDMPVNFTLSGVDPDGDGLTFMVVTQPRNGTLSGTAPALRYTPNANFNGTDSLTFKTNDSKLDSEFTVLNFNVTPVNDAPTIAIPQNANINEAQRLAFNLTASDIDGGQTFTFSSNNLPQGATLSPAGAFAWTPGNKQAGTYNINFTVTDSGTPPLTDTKTLTVIVTNPGPTASAMNVILDEDTPRQITLSVNDPDGDALTYTIVNAPQHGTLSGTEPNLVYTPALNYNGPDVFSFKASDGIAESNTAAVNLTINPINDAPVLSVPATVSGNENEALTFTITATDVDANQVIALATGTLPNGAQFVPATGVFTWTPTFNQAGSYTVNFTAQDNGSPVRSDAKSVTITINNVNRPPVANPNSVNVAEDTPTPLTLTGSDPDNDALTYTILTPPRNGTLTGTAPALTYTPNQNFFGTDTFTFRTNDATLESPFATVQITVQPVNDAPVLTVPGPQSVNEGQTLSFVISGADIDGPTPLRFSAPTLPSGASFDEPNRTFTWTPNFDQAGTFTATLQVADSANPPGTDTKTVTITVNNVNRAPVADNKTASTDEEVPVQITFTGSDPDQQSVTFAVVGQPTNGTLSGTAPTLTYTPNKDFFGTDTFTYRASDGSLNSPNANVTITVRNINDAPVANTQSVAASEDTPKAIVLTASDVDLNMLTYAVVAAPMHGTLSGTAPNLTYTPALNYVGPDAFTFKANDGTVDSNVATINITVGGVNDPPGANSQEVTTDEDTPKLITLTGSDIEGNSLTFAIVSQPTRGTLTGTLPNVTYTPNTNIVGTDSFTFKANDGSLDSGVATVLITINPVNDKPTINAPATQTVNENSVLAFSVSATDPDQGQTLSYSVVNLPSGATFDANTGAFSWTPSFTQAGSYTVTFTVTDNGSPAMSDSKAVAITVNNVLRPPTANGQSVMTDEDITKSITLSGVDPEDQTLTYMIVTQPANGTLSGTPPAVVYAPNGNYNGADSFTFKVIAGGRESAPATVNITVNAINDAPVITAPDTRTANEGDAITFTVSASDVDAGQTVTLSNGTLPSGATFNVNTGAFAWTPTFQQSGTYPIVFTATDNGSPTQATSKTVTITVNDFNRAPSADSKPVSTNEDTAVAITLTGSDPEGDTISFTVVTPPVHGTLSGTAPNMTYVPGLNYNGQDTITYKANDGRLDSVNALITITVNPVNDPPTLTVPGTQNVAPNQPVNFTVSATDPDAGQTVTLSAANLPSGATFTPGTGAFAWTPTVTGSFTVSFTATDSTSPPFSDTKTVTIVVSAVAGNNPPVCQPQEVITDEDTPKAITLVCTDADNDPITISVVQSPLHGLLSTNSGANITYSPNGNYFGGDNFSFRANDGKVNGETAIVSLTVNPVCDAPALTVPATQTVSPTQLLSFTVTASDVDSPVLTLSATNLPSGATFVQNPNSNSGQFSWTPDASFPTGTITVNFTVTDDCNPTLTDTKSVRITVGQSDAWVQGNGPEGGKVTSAVVNGSTVFVGTLGGGVFRSTDGGINWTRVNSGLPILDITTLALGDGALYAGTSGEGVFRSLDNGATWTDYNASLTQGFVYAMTTNATHIYAVVADTAFSAPIIRRSTFSGSGWADYNTNFPSLVVATDLQIIGGNIYASTFSDGVYVSSTTNANWQAFNTGFPLPALRGKTPAAKPLPTSNRLQRIAANKLINVLKSAHRTNTKYDKLALSVIDLRINSLAASSNTLYAATDDRVWATPISPTANVANWNPIGTGLTFGTATNAIEVINGRLYARTEVIDFVTTYDVISTPISNINWTVTNNGILNRAANVFVGNADFVLAGTEGSGVYRTTDAGANWTARNSGLTAAAVSSLFVDGTRLLAGTDGSGVFASTDDGVTWSPLNNGLTSIFPLNVTRFAQAGTTLYAGTCGHGVYRSTDSGATWSSYNTADINGACAQDLLVNDNTLYAAFGDLGTWVTPTASTSWNFISGLNSVEASALFRNSTNLFVGSAGGSLYRSDLTGGTWTQVGNGMDNTMGIGVTSLAQRGTGMSAVLFAGRNSDGVYRSPDNGTGFTSESTGMTQRAVSALQLNNTTLYAATNGGGVFYTTDDGENWTQIISNLTNLRLRALVIKGGKLFVGTEGSGVFFRPVRE